MLLKEKMVANQELKVTIYNPKKSLEILYASLGENYFKNIIKQISPKDPHFLCRLPYQERHIGIAFSPVVCCVAVVVKTGYHLALPSTCFDGFQPKLGHRYNMGIHIC